MTKEKKIMVGIMSILTLVIVILSYFLINKNATIEKQAEEIELQAMETNGSNSYTTTKDHLNEASQSGAVIKTASVPSIYGNQVLTFDFSELPNKEQLTIDDFITSPSQGRTGYTIPYSNTRTFKSLLCANTYNSETGILTMSLEIHTIDNTSQAIISLPGGAYAIYIPKK